MLEEITEPPLKPQQRLTLLKRHCLPKLLQQLVLGAVHRNTLKRLDLQVRQAFSFLLLSADDWIQCSPQKSLQYERLPLSLLPSLVCS
ncbi:hypothetical protein AAHC03_026725 [Spirometra sp. Aus1]